MSTTRYGVHRLMDSRYGSSHSLQWLEVNAGHCIGYHPLQEEQASTLWIGGTVVLSGCDSVPLPLPASCKDLVAALQAVPGDKAWHISSSEWASGKAMALHLLE